MAWSSPRTWATSELVTAAHMNQEVRDNFHAGFPTGTAFTTWSPSVSNITTTSGTTVARYIQVGKMVYGYYRFTLGASSAIGTGPTISLPVTASSSYSANVDMIGTGNIRAAGTAYPGFTQYNSTTTMRPVVIRTDTTDGQLRTLTATVPGTFTTADTLSLEFTYEAA